ncbi:hypothetical protein MHK_003230, partial [Candidatus Magnetomorum sp. HK-1]
GTTFVIQIPKSQSLEKQTSPSSEKRAFGYCKGQFYEFTPDASGGYSAKPVDRNLVPDQLLKKWKESELISSE